MTRKEEILQGLNDAQKKVVQSINGKYMVTSVAGSGKTKSMVCRAAYMIASGIPASQILMFTFTRKAAQEIKERVTKFAGAAARGMWISTYHAFCSNILRKYVEFTDRKKGFTIYDGEECRHVIKDILLKLRYNANTKGVIEGVMSRISAWKEELFGPKEAQARASVTGNPDMTMAAEAYQFYAQALKDQNAYDYDDLVAETIKLLEKNPKILEAVNNQYKYIMADEFQDSSQRDLQLISLLAGSDNARWNLMCIGDDSQSIYSFRGADLGSVLSFIQDNNLTILNMGQNYRSTKTIVEASDQLIKRNQERIEKEVFTENEEGDKITLITTELSTQEPVVVKNMILYLTEKEGYSYNDIAILYRINAQSGPLEKTFTRVGIPYKVLSGTAFTKREEVADMLAYIRLVINQNDFEAFKRVVNVPKRYVGDQSIKAILDYAAEHKVSLMEACEKAKIVQGRSRNGLKNFMAVIGSLQEYALMFNGIDNQGYSAADLVKEIKNLTNYDEYLKDRNEPEDTINDRIENTKELISMAYEYDTIEGFMESLLGTAVEEDKDSEDKPCVKLLTIHGSKGLEWPVVIIVGVNEGTIPHRLDILDGNIEEARRLFYVAMTRAKKRLVMTKSKKGVDARGNVVSLQPSRFLKDISSKYFAKR